MALLADLVDPFLIVLTLVAPLAMHRGQKFAPWPFFWRMALGVATVYLIMALDRGLGLWGRFGLDYSTHMALAVSLAISLAALSRRWLAVVIPILLANAWLMMTLGYHTALDILTTAFLVGPITWAIHWMGVRKSANAELGASERLG